MQGVKASVDAHWHAREYKSLNEHLELHERAVKAFRGYEGVYSPEWSREIRRSVESDIESVATAARLYVQVHLHSSLPYYHPTILPSYHPTFLLPTFVPSYLPTFLPSFHPTILPSYLPTSLPPYLPTLLPSYLPTIPPSHLPTFPPSHLPTFPTSHIACYVYTCRAGLRSKRRRR